MVSKNKVSKLAIYRELAKYQEIEDIPFHKISKKFNISKTQYGGLISSIRRSPKAYRALRDAGYNPEQIPQWYRREVKNKRKSHVRTSSKKRHKKFVKTRPRIGNKQLEQPDTSRDDNNTPPASGGYPMGQSKLLTLYDGSVVRVIALPEGSIKVETVKEPVEDIDTHGGETSEFIMRELLSEKQPLIRKVAFNPAAYEYYYWLLAQTDANGEPLFTGDFGDFVNLCIKFTMRVGFGVKLTITRIPGSALDLLLSRYGMRRL